MLSKTIGTDNGCTANLRDVLRRSDRAGLSGGRYKRSTLTERMAARTVLVPSGCWEFQGVGNRYGHQYVMVDARTKKRALAHRIAWEAAHGPIPAGQVVCHTCDNPRCVNPSHLFVGTQAENVYDAIHKGRYNTFGRQKLNAVKVREIRRRAAAGELQKDIARDYGIARNTVSGIVHGHSWQHLD